MNHFEEEPRSRLNRRIRALATVARASRVSSFWAKVHLDVIISKYHLQQYLLHIIVST